MSLKINSFQRGIAESPHKGFGLMRCVDLEAFPGAVTVNSGVASLFVTAFSGTFTADASTDVITVSGFTVPSTGTAVVLTTSGTLPAGLALATTYFIINVSTSTLKLATTLTNADAGTQIDITDAGSGTHTMTSRNPGTITHIVKSRNGSDVRFFHDSNARVWYLISGSTRCRLLNGNTLTSGVGNGLVTFVNSDASKEYLITFRNSAVDIIEVTATVNLTTPSWTNSWNFGGASSDTALNSTAGSNNSHHCIVGQDNIIYFVDAKYVGTISEIAGQVFSPSNTATYIGTDQALDMPNGEINQWLEELGTSLLIAGGTFNKIYPWDRTSGTFDLPINVAETGVKKIKNIGGVIYVLAGTWGNIYTTQGSYTRLFAKIPEQLSNNAGTLLSNPVTWGGIGVCNGSLLVGAGVQTSGNSGVYQITPDGQMVIDQIPSSGSANVTAFESTSTGNFYYFGYAGGADYHTGTRYANFEAVIQSPLYNLANHREKTTYSSLEVEIAKPATTGSIRVSYRIDTSSAFTTLTTYATDSSTTVFGTTDIGLNDLEKIQVQIEFHGTVEIVEVRLLEE